MGPKAARRNKPQLGYATTREMLTELKARGELAECVGECSIEMADMAMYLLHSLPESMLNYRTVDIEKWRIEGN